MTSTEQINDIDALTVAVVPEDWSEVDRRAVDTVRVLAADAVQKVGNGHPGTAMSLAPLAYTLFQRVMRHDPADPHWLGRDRFVLSCGHSSLTLYIQLYLAGFGLELDDLKALRTWGSLTPGHPEYHHTKGVEITTGPLGQGLASAVGMAMASRRERGLFEPDAASGESPFDHFIYVVASDGDMEEGVTSEASSIAGRQQLGNLIVFYDHNEISIEDDTNIALSEDVAARYEAYGWHVQKVHGGENVVGILEAIEAAKAVTDKPSFIELRTIIGYPASKLMNTGKAHGAALGAEEVAAVKTILGFDPDASFEVDDVVIKHTRQAVDRGEAARARWQQDFDSWAAANPARRARSRWRWRPPRFAPRREALQAQGIGTRVVSVPCLDWFQAQDSAYIESVLPSAVTARVSIEAGIAQPWWRWLGSHGRPVSLEHYGASADFKVLYQEFGITAEAAVAAAHESLTAAGAGSGLSTESSPDQLSHVGADQPHP